MNQPQTLSSYNPIERLTLFQFSARLVRLYVRFAYNAAREGNRETAMFNMKIATRHFEEASLFLVSEEDEGREFTTETLQQVQFVIDFLGLPKPPKE